MQAQDYVIGAGVGVDDNGGLSVVALADVALRERTWLTLSGGFADSETRVDDLRTRSLGIGLTQQFEKLGFSVNAGRWGDSDNLESDDLQLSAYWDNRRWRFGVNLERRDIKLNFLVPPPVPGQGPVQRQATATADGLGLSVRYRFDKQLALSFGIKDFDYNRNLNRLASLDFIRRISPTTLTLAGALRDRQATVDLEWEVGEQVFGIELARDRLAIGEFDLTSLSGRWTRPMTQRTDIEIGIGYSEPESGDGTLFASLTVYFFGG